MGSELATIYVDLDGTVLDISEKYWRLHDHLSDALGDPALERKIFWRMKRHGAGIAKMWKDVPPESHAQYDAEFVRLIEEPEYLRFDIPHEGATEALRQLSKDYRLVLATMRRNPHSLVPQLRDLGIHSLFGAVLHSALLAAGVSGKDMLIRRDTLFVAGSSMVVGDTEGEIEAGKRLGIPSVVVLNGLRDRATLAPWEPTHVIDSLRDLPRLLRSGGLSV